jgi:putative ABC transport system permease protein
MNFLESIDAGARAMAANKARALITTVGIVLGVASVVTLLSLMRGGQQQTEAYFAELGGARELRITNTRTDRVFMSAAERASERLTYRDAQAVLANCPSVLTVDPEITRFLDVSYHDKNFMMKILGTSRHYPYADDMPVVEGRFISDEDCENHANVVMLGPTYKQDLFGDEDAIGKTIVIQGVPFTVVGIMQKKEFYFRGGGGGGDRNVLEWFNRSLYIPITTMVKRFTVNDRLDGLEIAARSVEAVPALTEETRTVLLRRHGVEDFTIESKSGQIAAQNQEGAFFNIIFSAVAFVSLFVGGVVIANIMLASIAERIREIGVRKAIGASGYDVFVEFLLEAIVVTTSGGLAGILLGLGFTAAVDRFLGMPADLTPTIVAIALLTSVGVGVVFGMLPAIRAARLNPVEALRYE